MSRIGARLAGVIGAAAAALCCIGVPVVLSTLASLGLAFLRDDRLLLPVMIVGLGVSIRSLWMERQSHFASTPTALGLTGAGSLLAGVFVWHGTLRTWLVLFGGVLTFTAVWWSASLVRTCNAELPQRRR